MNFKSKALFFFNLFMFAIVACQPALYIPTLADSQRIGVACDTLVIGRNLYVKNCGSCHNLYKTDQFTKKEWAKAMVVMQKKTKCNDQETKLIMKYLITRPKQG